jgi:Zn-dependent protease with chaperone function
MGPEFDGGAQSTGTLNWRKEAAMLRARSTTGLFLLLALCAVPVSVGQKKPKELKPGWNLFSKEQDVQLGQEASREIEKQVQLLTDPEVNQYVQRIGKLLASQPQADKYPYTFKVVVDKSINAFALPGGPTYLHTGLISAAENEGQIAGVMAHEIAHVALRHGTNQVTKANFIQLPALLAGAVVGGRGITGQLAQLGVGFGAGSLLLKFSRGAESDADLLGARLMSQSGYNPIEMARFFEKLEAETGKGSALTQFLSDHPNPGNRVKAVEAEIRLMPRRDYNADSGQLPRVKEIVKNVKVEPKKQPAALNPSDISSSRPSPNLRAFRGHGFEIAYPDNWQTFGASNAPSVTIAPRGGIGQDAQGGVQVGYGVMIAYFAPEGQRRGDLRRDTSNLIREMQRANTSMRAGREAQRGVTIDGQQGLLTTLYSQSPFPGETEVDVLLTVQRPEGLFYMVFIAPEREFQHIQQTFQQILRSLRFTG